MRLLMTHLLVHTSGQSCIKLHKGPSQKFMPILNQRCPQQFFHDFGSGCLRDGNPEQDGERNKEIGANHVTENSLEIDQSQHSPYNSIKIDKSRHREFLVHRPITARIPQ